jgi:hypothetical protein
VDTVYVLALGTFEAFLCVVVGIIAFKGILEVGETFDELAIHAHFFHVQI